MEHSNNSIAVNTGTNPMLTMAIFVALIVILISAGTHFSGRNNAAKELEIAMEKSVNAAGSMGR